MGNTPWGCRKGTQKASVCTVRYEDDNEEGEGRTGKLKEELMNRYARPRPPTVIKFIFGAKFLFPCRVGK